MGTDVKPPPLVEADPIATSAWHLAVGQLQEQGKYQDSDRISIERYSVLAALARRYSEDCMKTRGIQRTRSGYRQLSPEFSCLLKASKELQSLEKSLGLSPAARDEAGISATAKDEFEEWMDANPL